MHTLLSERCQQWHQTSQTLLLAQVALNITVSYVTICMLLIHAGFAHLMVSHMPWCCDAQPAVSTMNAAHAFVSKALCSVQAVIYCPHCCYQQLLHAASHGTALTCLPLTSNASSTLGYHHHLVPRPDVANSCVSQPFLRGQLFLTLLVRVSWVYLSAAAVTV